MKIFRIVTLLMIFPALAAAQNNKVGYSNIAQQAAVASPAPAISVNDAVDRTIEREHAFLQNIRNYTPLIETYIQNLRNDAELGTVPSDDKYFLGRVQLISGIEHKSFLADKRGFGRRLLDDLTKTFSLHFVPGGFASMIMVDANGLDRQHYNFEYVGREFLGDVRCLLFNVTPVQGSGPQRFKGRIWVEDQNYNIVRFNGIYGPDTHRAHYLHFDSWRMNLQPGQWLPAYVYTEEADLPYSFVRHMRLKGQTRFWGYSLGQPGHQEELTSMEVEAPSGVRDTSDSAKDFSPVERQRAWERQAEDNVIERLQKVGLLAPAGNVDKVLQTVVNNLEITNKLDIQPEVRGRVMLTSSLESFTVGHTIVVSRGLLDVLPDEASLAMILAHELGHIVLGHHIDTRYSFDDRMLFPDEQTFRRIHMARNQAEENAADQKGLELLSNSPYKDKLGSAGLFLRALSVRAGKLNNLISPHLGNRLASSDHVLRMAKLVPSAPQLQPNRTDQIAALPLGGRINVDPWSDSVEMMKTKAIPLLSPREKMQFEVTPVMLYLTRLTPSQPTQVGAQTAASRSAAPSVK
jgi:hypothetical protein